jgi:hypothetical protein
MKYKLIKEYPGSPELGSIAADVFLPTTINKDWFPEFWEKVEELNYEILTVKPSEANTVNKNKEAIVTWHVSNNNLKYWNINSVKRLSDGEVFTIGDLIDFSFFGNKGFKKIEGFAIDYFENKLMTAYQSAYGIGIALWKKAPVKTPLFTTEDGVVIFERDMLFYVLKSFEIHNNPANEFDGQSNDYKYFSTKEKADEYIFYNKPYLSLMDLLRVRENSNRTKPFPLFKELEEIVRSRS